MPGFFSTARDKIEDKGRYQAKRLKIVSETAEDSSIRKETAFQKVERLYKLLPERKMLDLDASIAFSGINLFDKSKNRGEVTRKLARAAIFLVRFKRTLDSVPDSRDVDANRAQIRIDTAPTTGNDCHGLTGSLPRPDNKNEFLKFIDDNFTNLVEPVKKLFDDFVANEDKWLRKIDKTSRTLTEHTKELASIKTDAIILTARVNTLEISFGELRGRFDSEISRFQSDIYELNRGWAGTKEKLSLLTTRVDKQDGVITALSKDIGRRVDDVVMRLKYMGESIRGMKKELDAADQKNAADIERLTVDYEAMKKTLKGTKKTAAKGLASVWLAIDCMKIQSAFSARVYSADKRLENLSNAVSQGFDNYSKSLGGANREVNELLNCIDGSLKGIAAVTPPPFNVIVHFARTMRKRVITTTDLGGDSSIASPDAPPSDASSETEDSSGGGSTEDEGGGDGGEDGGEDGGGDGVPRDFEQLKADLLKKCDDAKEQIKARARDKFDKFRLTIGWTAPDLDTKAIQDKFIAARDQMVVDGNKLIEESMAQLINRKLIEECIQSILEDEKEDQTADKLAEDIYNIIKAPFSEALEEWVPTDGRVDIWNPDAVKACATVYELMFYGTGFVTNRIAGTSIVDIPDSFIQRFRALEIVVPQVVHNYVAQIESMQETLQSQADKLQEHQNRWDSVGYFTRAGDFIKSAGKSVGQSIGSVGGAVASKGRKFVDAGADMASRVTRSQKSSGEFYKSGVVPWRTTAQGSNSNHALVLQLVCLDVMATYTDTEFAMFGDRWGQVINKGTFDVKEFVIEMGDIVETSKRNGQVLQVCGISRRRVSKLINSQLFLRVAERTS